MELPPVNNLLSAMELPSVENLFVAAGLSAVIWTTAILAFIIY